MALVLSASGGGGSVGPSIATGIKVDSDGRVTQSTVVAFMAYGGPYQQLTTPEVMQFTSTLLNTGNCYSTTTYRFTAPIDGTYRFSTSWMTHNGQWDRAIFRKNGSQVAQQFYASSAANVGVYARLDYEIIIALVAGDYIDVYRNPQSEAGTGAHPDYRHFAGNLLG
jgi:hypothetical protein